MYLTSIFLSLPHPFSEINKNIFVKKKIASGVLNREKRSPFCPMYLPSPGLWVPGKAGNLVELQLSPGPLVRVREPQWETLLVWAVPEHLTPPETDSGSEGAPPLGEDWWGLAWQQRGQDAGVGAGL